ncbi:hypothetical protein C1N87_30995 (plasmid) [Priestia aryabhattai]
MIYTNFALKGMFLIINKDIFKFNSSTINGIIPSFFKHCRNLLIRKAEIELSPSVGNNTEVKTFYRINIHIYFGGRLQSLLNITYEEAELLLLFLSSYKKGSIVFYRDTLISKDFIKIPSWARKKLLRELKGTLNKF